MFICRHHLLRVNVTKSLPFPRIRPFVFSAHFALRHTTHARLLSGRASNVEPTSSLQNTNHAPANFQRDDAPHHPSSRNKAASPPVAVPTARKTENALKHPRVFHPVEAHILLHMPVTDLKRALDDALTSGTLDDVRKLAADVMANYRGRFRQDRNEALVHVLSLAREQGILDIKTIHRLSAELASQNYLMSIPPGVAARVLKTVQESAQLAPNQDPHDEVGIYTHLAPVFFATLNAPPPTELYRREFHKLGVAGAIWALFKIIRRLLQLNKREVVMPIFQNLVKTGTIPEKAMQGLPATGFTHIILTVILRCCIEFKWPSRAVVILISTPLWDQARSPAFNEVLEQVLDFVLTTEEEPASPKLATALMVRVIQNPDVLTLSDAIINRFYDLLHNHNHPEQAEAFYMLTREPDVMVRHHYSSPQGKSWVWLFRYAVQQKNVFMSRLLVRDVLESGTSMPPLERAFVVLETAAQGNMTYARALWEKYSDDPFVIADAGTTLRIVSLAMNRVGALKHRAVHEHPHASRYDLDEGDSTSKLDTQSLTEPHGDPNLAEDVIRSRRVAKRASSAGSAPGDALNEPGDTELYEEQVVDHRAFAERVVEKFRHCHEPLIRAPHKVVNALARAYIILGMTKRAFEVLKVISERGDEHDIRDVNVALSALAQSNPQASARMISEMVYRGLQPTAVTFGTAIHHAVLHGEMRLVTSLIIRARQVGIEELSYKTISTLIRSAISAPYDESLPHKTQLENVQNLLDSLLAAEYTVSPKIGMDCIQAALRADEPVTAFNFWQLLVEGKTELWDYKQRAMRARIARNIRRHYALGRLSRRVAKDVLKQLGEDTRIDISRLRAEGALPERKNERGERPSEGDTKQPSTDDHRGTFSSNDGDA